MKRILLSAAFVLICAQLTAQDYLDLIKVSYNNATLGNIVNDDETNVKNTYVEFYYPFPISSKATFIGGFTYENTRLGAVGFEPDRTNLVMTRLNLGLKLTHGNDWTGTYVALPRYSTDFRGFTEDNFQMGGLALFEKRFNARKGFKAGLYASSEEFGTILTPLVGYWYKSKNGKFYINAILPIRSEMQYDLPDGFSLGASLVTSVKSYNLAQRDDFYIQEESIRFNVFLGVDIIEDELLLRGKVGFDTTDYGLYKQGDTVGTQILTFQVDGDDRNRLNSEFDSSLFLGFDLVYRVGI